MILRTTWRATVGYATACLVFQGACRSRDAATSSADSQAAHVRDVIASGGVVDSILPIAEQLRRFRADIPEQPDTLRRASASIDALVKRWAAAVATRDTAALNHLVLDRAEFAWLYYPASALSKPPYESPPQLLWGQIVNNSDNGARQLLARFGGARFDVASVTCPAPSDSTATGRVYANCQVRVRVKNGRVSEGTLFGSIVEHRGRFKFLSYANRL